MRIAGIVLIVLGIVGLAYGGFTYTRRRDTINVGPLSATVQQRETVPISPVLSGLAIAAGAGLLLAARRKRA